MTPVIRRTWGRRGVPPTLPLRTWSRDKVSGLGVLVVSPWRRRLTLYLALYPKANIRGPQVLLSAVPRKPGDVQLDPLQQSAILFDALS